MPKYLIERDMPNIGQKSMEEVQDLVRKTVDTLDSMGQKVHWLESFITNNKIYAVYLAPNEQVLQDLAKKTNIPATKVSEVTMVIDPSFVDAGKRQQFKPTASR